jgi:hypothetical protein
MRIADVEMMIRRGTKNPDMRMNKEYEKLFGFVQSGPQLNNRNKKGL